MRRSLKYVKPHWRLGIYSALLVLASVLVGLLEPWPLAFLFDSVFASEGAHNNPVVEWLKLPLGSLATNPVALILLVVAAKLVIMFVHRFLDVFDGYVHTKLDLRVGLDFRSELFQHVMKLSLAHHDRKQSGMMIYAVNNMGDAVARLIMIVPGLAHSVFTLIGMIWFAIAVDWELALLSLTVLPFLYYSVGYYSRHIHERMYNVKAMEGQSLSIIHEAISMIRVIVAFGREKHEYQRFRTQSETALDARLKLTVRQTLFTMVVDTITAIGSGLVLGYGAWHVYQKEITAGELLIILAYIASIYKPLEAISTTVGSFQDIFTSLKFAFDILDTVPDIQDRPDAIALEKSRGHIVFENVGFSYAERTDTLKDISFEAKPGQVIGLVGPTGAGKTTLISLLPRFYDSIAGRILFDGHDIKTLKLRSLRDQVSIVLQEPLLFSGTIRDNIMYSNLEATQSQVETAARNANAHEFISKLPQGYDTELGERGAKLSGGERQRIAVARAFLRDAPILILDEPTSSIDSKTEAVILDALDRLMAGRTTFMIAHRLSTIRRADIILVLDQGRLVERGHHEDLVTRGGLYQSLYEMQTQQRQLKTLIGLEDEEPLDDGEDDE